MTITITSPQQRDQLPAGVIVQSADGTIACRHTRGVGVVFGDERPFPWDRLSLPITILMNPDRTLAIDAEVIAAAILATAQDHGMVGIHGAEADILAEAARQAIITTAAP